jgi:predicted ATPase
MRLKSVWISEYKNIRDLTLTFDGESFLDIFVGKNGTGKSNFFEALVEIYRHIFDSRTQLEEIGFDYEITYEIEGTDTTISRRGERFTINGKDRRTVGQTPVPDNVLIYYSGHNTTIRKTVERYADAFAGRSKNWASNEVRKFISIGSEYKELLLSVMLMQPEACVARHYICEKLKIEVSGETATLRLIAPDFNHPEVDVGDTNTFLWSAKGITKTFLERLLSCVKGGFTEGGIYDREKDVYSIPINLEMFSERFSDFTSSEVFRNFDNLMTLGMFGGLSIPLRLQRGDVAKVGDFSDGQFQSVYIYAISELFKDRNCITLLDEPDSFLHPEWQFGFLEQVGDIAGTQAAQTNHVLLSSHSASTIARSDPSQIRIFEFNEGVVSVQSKDKTSIIKSLSAGLITFSEGEARLNISHNLKNTDGPVLFVEGVSDEIILETAWGKLNPGGGDRPFEIQSAYDCGFLGRLLRDEELYRNHPERAFFGLFDFDDAYNDWNMINSQDVELDPTRCLTKKRNGVDGYSMLLPVPNNHSARSQVINPDTGTDYKSKSRFPIELLFKDVPGLEDHFENDPNVPGNCARFKGKKTAFAKKVVARQNAECFECFRPIFDFVLSKIG